MSKFNSMVEFLIVSMQENKNVRHFFNIDSLLSFVKDTCPKSERDFKVTIGSVREGLLEASKNHALVLRTSVFDAFVLHLGNLVFQKHARYPTSSEVALGLRAFAESFGSSTFDDDFVEVALRPYNIRDVIRQNPEWDAQMSARRGAQKANERITDFSEFLTTSSTSEESTPTLDDLISEACESEQTPLGEPTAEEALIMDFIKHMLSAFIVSTDANVYNPFMLHSVAKIFLETRKKS